MPTGDLYVLGLDLGGSKISGAIVDSQLNLVAEKTVPSRDTISGIADPGMRRTKSLIAELCAEARIRGIDLTGGAVGFPEYVNLEGLLTSADNIDWTVQPQEEFARLTGFSWHAQSDVRCAGVAEARIGAGRGVSDFVYITVSSGISHTHFLHSRAVTGPRGEAIGFGLTGVDIAGGRFVLENYCSGLGIARRYADKSSDFTIDAKVLTERFDVDDEAHEIISSACTVLGFEMAKLAAELSTHLLVVGGGLWLGSPKYRELTTDSFHSGCRRMGIDAEIRNAEVAHSGVIGAAIYAFAELDFSRRI